MRLLGLSLVSPTRTRSSFVDITRRTLVCNTTATGALKQTSFSTFFSSSTKPPTPPREDADYSNMEENITPMYRWTKTRSGGQSTNHIEFWT